MGSQIRTLRMGQVIVDCISNINYSA
jgi:hypothetical protein